MDMITANRDTCTKCGACAAECPFMIVAMNGENGYPGTNQALEKLCINCGHCVSVCPESALTHRHLKPEECLEVKKEWLLSPEQGEHFLRYRRSIRNYLDKPVPREDLERLIEIARYAPTGHNMQPVNWLVVHDREELQRLGVHVTGWMKYLIENEPEMAASMHLELVVGAWEAGMDRIFHGAPHLILAHGNKANPTCQGACTIALTYLDLAAPSFGLGTCWAGFFQLAAMFWPPMEEALGLPEGHGSFGALMTGYPRYRYHRMPERNKPKIIWK